MSLLAGKETLYQAYDMQFGIHDYMHQIHSEARTNNPNLKRPLSSVALHPAEDFSGPDTPLGNIIKSFVDLKISSSTGLSLTEFLEYPHEYVELVMRIARKNADLDAKVQSNVLAEMQNQNTKK